MAYKKTTWVDEQTDVNAENLNNIEEGVETLDIELGKIKTAVGNKADSVHEHSDLERRIKAVEDAQAEAPGVDVDLSGVNSKIEEIENNLAGKAEANHSHDELSEIEGLRAAIETINQKIARIEQAMEDGSGDGHFHTELEEKVTALETGKADAVHTHNASDIIVSHA